jgi:hypothetical protein
MKMQETIITRMIDGRCIIVGTGRASIDQKATIPIVDNEIKKTDEWKDYNGVQVDIKNFFNQLKKDRASLAIVKKDNPNNQALLKESQDKITARQVSIAEKKELLVEKEPALMLKRRELIKSKAVYNPLGCDNFLMDTDLKNSLFELNTQIAGDSEKAIEYDKENNTASIIPNLAGKIYYKKLSGGWQRQTVIKIGESPKSGYKPYGQLTDAEKADYENEKEAERISALSPTAKEAEKQGLLDGVASQALHMEGVLRIQGDPDYVQKAQDWHDSEIVTINERYL